MNLPGWPLRGASLSTSSIARRKAACGWRHASPWTSYGGTLTGLNFTELHPNYANIAATWNDEHYSIAEERSVLQFSKASSGAGRIVTQAVIKIDAPAPPDEAFLPARPKAGREEQTERCLVGWADLAEFFTRASIQNGQLVYVSSNSKSNACRVVIMQLWTLVSETLPPKVSTPTTSESSSRFPIFTALAWTLS